MESISTGYSISYLQNGFNDRGLPLKKGHSRLNDAESHHFKVYEKKNDITPEDFVNQMSKEFKIDMANYYYCDPSRVENYLFVEVWSGRTSAILTSNLISNECPLELKNVHCTDSIILLVFKKIKEHSSQNNC